MTIAPQRPIEDVLGRRDRYVTAGQESPGRTPRHAVPVQRNGGGPEEPFRILFVCTGNVCRSPSAELLTRHLLVGRLGGRGASRVQVASAGVRAVVGAPVHPGSRAQLAPWGLDGVQSERFVARQIEGSVVAGVDLVLGATPRHRSAVLERFPHLLGATFSLREFARLVERIDARALPADLVGRSRAMVEAARHLRGTITASGDDRVPDPIGGSEEDFRRATTLTFEAVCSIVDVVAPRSAPTGRSIRFP